MITIKGITYNITIKLTREYPVLQDLIKHTVTNLNIRKNPNLAFNSMFNKTGKELLDSLDTLMQDLTMKKGGDLRGFTNYIEGYFARIGKGGKVMPQRAIDDLPIEMKAAFTKETTLDVAKQPLLGLDEAMASRINAQGNEMFLYPALREISETAGGVMERQTTDCNLHTTQA